MGCISGRDDSSQAELAYVLSTFHQTSQRDPEILLRYYYHSNKALLETSKAGVCTLIWAHTHARARNHSSMTPTSL